MTTPGEAAQAALEKAQADLASLEEVEGDTVQRLKATRTKLEDAGALDRVDLLMLIDQDERRMDVIAGELERAQRKVDDAQTAVGRADVQQSLAAAQPEWEEATHEVDRRVVAVWDALEHERDLAAEVNRLKGILRSDPVDTAENVFVGVDPEEGIRDWTVVVRTDGADRYPVREVQ